MPDILTMVIFASAVVGGLSGFAAMVLIFMKKPVRPAVVVFSVCMIIAFVAMLMLPRS